jgi:phosphoribosylamine--glycine ligase
MKIMIVGSGGREHAIALKLSESERVKKILCIPGNGGTATVPKCQNIAMNVNDFDGIARFAGVQGMSLVIVGPEVPLANGIADYLQAQNIPVFGPTKAGARIEASKIWAKTLMAKAGVPMGTAECFTNTDAAKTYIKTQTAPLVVKADSLAAGKGVIVAETIAAALEAVDLLWEQGFKTLVVEEYLTGEEVSIFAITDGQTFRTLIPAQDHKRIGEGDTGENTGGMGVYAPAPLVTPALMERIEREIIAPILSALRAKGIDYRGVLYAGLMISESGDPKVLEFNCRFGDPETQVVLPLLNTPLETLVSACVNQTLETLPPLEWEAGCAVCVVASAEGYPGKYRRGDEITGIEAAQEQGALVFHAGTQRRQQQVLTSGGRVLGVTALGDDFEGAIAKAYAAIAAIEFEGMYYRRDIAHRVRPQPEPEPIPAASVEAEEVSPETEDEDAIAPPRTSPDSDPPHPEAAP